MIVCRNRRSSRCEPAGAAATFASLRSRFAARGNLVLCVLCVLCPFPSDGPGAGAVAGAVPVELFRRLGGATVGSVRI